MTTAPRLSVVIPAHDAVAHLEATLVSVLAQDVDGLEVVVVDDGSSDGTAELAATVCPDAVVHRQENAGSSAARNQGVAPASAPLLLFLDADDLWPMGAVQHRLAVLEGAPALDLVCTGFTMVDNRPDLVPGQVGDHLASEWWTFLLGTCLVRRLAFDRVGLFDPSLHPGEDTDWYLRARHAGLAIHRDPMSTLLYRQHPDSMVHRDRSAERAALFEVVRRQRRRSGTET